MKRGKFVLLFIIAVILFVMLLTAVGLRFRAVYYDDDLRFSDIAANRIHSLMNTEQFILMYDEADPVMQNSINRNEFVASVKGIRQRTGKLIKSNKVAARAFPNGQVRLAYDNTYEKGEMTEMIIFQSDGKQARLLWYKISPRTAPVNKKPGAVH